VTKRHWWNICLLVSWFRNNCVRYFHYAYCGASKTLRVCRAFLHKIQSFNRNSCYFCIFLRLL